jgi:phosphotransferase system IIB component
MIVCGICNENGMTFLKVNRDMKCLCMELRKESRVLEQYVKCSDMQGCVLQQRQSSLIVNPQLHRPSLSSEEASNLKLHSRRN